MTSRGLLGVLFGVGLGVSAAVACGNYVPPDVATYGPADGLSGKTPQPPSGDDTGDSGGSVTPPTGDSGGGPVTAEFLCQSTGGAIVDGGTCAVSFTGQIYPKMLAGTSGTTGWNCAGVVGCHGGTQVPSFAAPVAQSAIGYYGVLANYKMVDVNNVPYVNPCSIDPTQSAFACNTITPGGTGICGISMPSGSPMATADQQMIATWVACGAPFN